MPEEIMLEDLSSDPGIGNPARVPAPPGAEAVAPMLESQPLAAVEPLGPDWREELASKMQKYRTRRKPRAPKYPSLQIPLHLPSEVLEAIESFRPISADVSRSSNALEPAAKSQPERLRLGPELVETSSTPAPEPPADVAAPPPPTNLIEFPRSMDSEAWDGLAEPFIDQPRIIDAPELAPPEPALGGILLEQPPDANPNSLADPPVRPASITRRLSAVAVDAVIVACAVAVWAWIALDWIVAKMTHEIPPQTLGSVAAAAGALWLSYQYLLMVYSGTTPGLRACRLELVALDGTTPGRKQRRWRFLASLLSAASMMLGYAWVLLDEKQLCWHDRITHTYLRVRECRPL